MFEKLIGQKEVKTKLEFYASVHKETRTIPFLGFFAPKGTGKTTFAREFLKTIRREDGSERPFLEINCSTIRNNAAFFEQIFMSFLMNKEANVLFDEAHGLPDDVTQALLTICNTEKDPIREFRLGESTYLFDFTKISFVFATTEPDRLFPPLKDRLEPIEFRPYNEQDLADIVVANCPLVEFSEKILTDVVSTVRDNPRSAVKRSEQINNYAASLGYQDDIFMLEEKDWDSVKRILDIRDMGLENNEIIVLTILLERGPSSLQSICATSGMSRSAIQRSVENHLLKRGLIDIDGKRKLTEKGMRTIIDMKNAGNLPYIG